MNEKKRLDKMANPSSPQVVSGDPSGAEADGDKMDARLNPGGMTTGARNEIRDTN